MNDMTTVNKWFIYALEVLFALLALQSIDICIAHHWGGDIPCAAIAIAIFACVYGILRLCFACVKTFVTLRTVLPAVNIRILKKRTLTQGDLKNFSWNIANQYGIEPALTAQFVLSTFGA